MTPHKEQETADFIELKGWQGYTPPHMVQISLIVTDSDTVVDRTAERIYRKRTEIKEEADNGRI